MNIHEKMKPIKIWGWPEGMHDLYRQMYAAVAALANRFF